MAQSKDSQIQTLFWGLVEKGYTDKQIIYSKICAETGFSRPHVRRACGDLKKRLEFLLSILNKRGTRHVQKLEAN